VTRGEANQLSINTEQLAAAVETGRAEEQLNDAFGFTGQLARLGQVIVNDPSNFEMHISMAAL
jgi:hypothetical protein